MRLLVASHDASRTGAPILLLTFLRWLRRETDTEVQLVLWRGGPLEAAFAEVAETTVLHPPPGTRSRAETVDAVLAEVGLEGAAGRLLGRRVRRALDVKEHDVLLLNGAGAALVLAHLASGAPTLAWVHELSRGLTFSLQGPGRAGFLGADRVAVVSQAVADELVSSWAVDPARIVLRPGCVPDRTAGPPGPPPPPGPLVGSVGAGSWRKGIDRFVELAEEVHHRRPEVAFAWVGPLDEPAAVRADVDRRGVGEVVLLPGEVGDPDPWFAAMDVFVSTAREDPFPLVGLEAGAAGLPVVAFASGGLVDLLAEGRGSIVADLATMADEVLARLDEPGPGPERLRAHVAAQHRIEVLGPALWADLEALA